MEPGARPAGTPSAPNPLGPGNPDRPTLGYVFLRFLRYGWLAWGGPVAQIGLMHRELVERDGWVSEDRFRKTLALYQALPGPEAHELAVYFGMGKRGRAGGLVAGLGFMLPGVLLVTLLAALYVRYADLPRLSAGLLYGVRPAVTALIAAALWRLGRANLGSLPPALVALAGAAVALAWPGTSFVAVLLGGGVVAAAVRRLRSRPGRPRAGATALLPLLLGASAFPALSASGLAALALVCAKVGFLTFGGAYTAIPFLQRGAVEEYGWITNEQFLDGLALAGMVPGPLVAVGTFVGFLAGGAPGALVATTLIFLPAFGFTLLGHHFFERVIHREGLHAFLLGVTAAVIGLMFASTLPLARAAIVDAATAALGALAFVAFATRRVPIPWVMAAAGAAGIALHGVA